MPNDPATTPPGDAPDETPRFPDPRWTSREATRALLEERTIPHDAPIRGRMAALLGREPTTQEVAVVLAVAHRSPLQRGMRRLSDGQ